MVFGQYTATWNASLKKEWQIFKSDEPIYFSGFDFKRQNDIGGRFSQNLMISLAKTALKLLELVTNLNPVMGRAALEIFENQIISGSIEFVHKI